MLANIISIGQEAYLLLRYSSRAWLRWSISTSIHTIRPRKSASGAFETSPTTKVTVEETKFISISRCDVLLGPRRLL